MWLQDLTKSNKLAWDDDRSPIIIGLFHDICKIDQYQHPTQRIYADEKASDIPISDQWDYRKDTLLKGHGDKSVMILASHIQLTEEEVMCIRYHMGVFTADYDWNDYTRAVRMFPNVLWTHHADMIASHVIGI